MTRDHGAASLILDALYLTNPDAHADHLAKAACGVTNWEGFVETAEQHGVIGVLARNLDMAGVILPAPVASALEARRRALREDSARFAFTVESILRVFHERRIQCVLLKGASLVHDIYLDAMLRSQGDIDILVAQADIQNAVDAAASIGLLPKAVHYPVWWYRWTHFHLALAPANALLRAVEIHWALHSPSLLFTDGPSRIASRFVPIEIGAIPAWTLHPIDRLLHLVTHLSSHWRGIPIGGGRQMVIDIARSPTPRIRLKWLLDIASCCENLAVSERPEAALAEATSWNAANVLVDGLRLILATLPVSKTNRTWMTEVCRPVASRDRGVRTLRVDVFARTDRRCQEGLGFGWDAVTWLPRWVFPKQPYFEKRYGSSALLCRLLHSGQVLGFVIRATIAYPLAWFARLRLRAQREHDLIAFQKPDRVFTLVAAYRGSPAVKRLLSTEETGSL